MYWKDVLSPMCTAACAGALIVASTSVSANQQEKGGGAPSLELARALVKEYRELRRQCAEQSGDERKRCFHALHASNSEYRSAKAQLKLGQTEDPENVHLVIF